MGYIEDLRDKKLNELSEQLTAIKEQTPVDDFFKNDFAVVSFTYGIKSGYKFLCKINKLIKQIKNIKQEVVKKINEACSNLDVNHKDGKSLSKNEKKEFVKDVKNIFLEEFTNDYNQKLKTLRKIRGDVLLHLCTKLFYVLSIVLSLGFGAVLNLHNRIIDAVIYPVSIISLLGFVVSQVIYTVKYLKAIKADIQGVVLFCIKKAYSVLLVVWWYIAILVFINSWDVKIATYSFSAVFVLCIIGTIYDLFLSSSLFDGFENSLSLISAIIVGIFAFADTFNNELVARLGSGLLLVACVLLTLLIVKKFLFERKSIKGFLQIVNVVLITLTTICLTVVALYKLLWVTPQEGQVSDNTLFSAVMGIYAAILGGGLTLVGVAWTIKHSEKQRKHDEQLRVRPYVVLERPYETTEYLLLSLANNIEDHYKTCFPQLPLLITDNADCIFVGLIINDKFFPAITELFMQRNLRYSTDRLRCQELIETDRLFVVIKDLLDNYYKYECLLQRVEDETNNDIICYEPYEFSVPNSLNDEDLKIIQAGKAEK